MDFLSEHDERFDESGHRLVLFILKEARTRKQNRISVNHVLYALAREEPYLFFTTVSDLSHDPGSVTNSVEERLQNTRYAGEGNFRIDPDAKDLFARSLQRAKAEGRGKISALDLMTTLSQIPGFLSHYLPTKSASPPAPVKEEPHAVQVSKLGFTLLAVETFGILILLIFALTAVILVRQKFVDVNKRFAQPIRTFNYRPIQKFDPILDQNQLEAQNHRFNFHGKSGSSSAVLDLRQKEFKARSLIANGDYESLYCLLKELQSKGDLTSEFNILETWLTRRSDESPVSYYELRYYFHYIDTYYITPLDEAFKNAQYARAQWLSAEAAKRVRFVDSRLVRDYWIRRSKNSILLYELVFADAERSFGNSQEVGLLFETVKNNFSESNRAVLKAAAFKDSLEPLRNYWLGIYEFRDENFDEGTRYFSKAAESDNPALKQLSYLMQSRCIFWKQLGAIQQANESDSSVSIDSVAIRKAMRDLNDLVKSLGDSPYSNDVRDYIKTLEHPDL